jgi:hypothetical protein
MDRCCFPVLWLVLFALLQPRAMYSLMACGALPSAVPADDVGSEDEEAAHEGGGGTEDATTEPDFASRTRVMASPSPEEPDEDPYSSGMTAERNAPPTEGDHSVRLSKSFQSRVIPSSSVAHAVPPFAACPHFFDFRSHQLKL